MSTMDGRKMDANVLVSFLYSENLDLDVNEIGGMIPTQLGSLHSACKWSMLLSPDSVELLSLFHLVHITRISLSE